MSVRHSIKRKKNNDEKDCMGNHTVALLLHGNLETKSEFSFFFINKKSHRADFI